MRVPNLQRLLWIYIRLQLAAMAVAQQSGVVELVKRQNMTAEVMPESVEFDFCEMKPKFRPGMGSFLSYLMRLKLCSVTSENRWLEDACQEKVYAFTAYYRTAYLKFCDPATFEQSCRLVTQGGAVSTSHDPDVVSRWWLQRNRINISTPVISTASTSSLPVTKEDCSHIDSYFDSLVQWYTSSNVTSLPAGSPLNGTLDFNNPFSNPDYSEWFLAYRPFCEPVACGISRSAYKENPISSYDCFPECRSGIIFAMVFDSALAVIVVVANILVLVVAVRTQIMRNIPGYFKISLAAADLMIGLFVLPGSVYQNYVLYIAPLPYREEGQRPKATDYFDQRYLNFMGVFTVLSFGISIYTMGAASVDRYLAITRPFRYRQGKYLTTKRVGGVFAVIWLFALVCAIYPTFLQAQYDISALSLVLATGSVASAIYAITLGIPLIAVWIINGMMLKQVCADGENRRSMSGSHQTVTTRLSSGPAPSENATSESANTQNNNNYAATKGNRPSARPKELQKSRFNKFTTSMRNTFKFARHPSLAPSSSNPPNQASVERKLAKTLAVMIGAFTMAILPSIIVLILISALGRWASPRSQPKSYSPMVMNALTSAEYIAARLFLSNSFWNCIIYSVRNRHFRRALVDSFICDEAKKRERRRGASLGSSRDKRLRKMGSTDSGCVSQSQSTSESGKRRRSTQVWEMSCVSRRNSDPPAQGPRNGGSRL